MRYQRTLCIIAGLLPLIVIVLLSITTGTDFILFNNFLSDLGVGQHAAVFNTTLIVAPLLALPFIFHVYSGRLTILFLATILSLIGVGLFSSTSWLHIPAASLFFLLALVTIMTTGTKMTRRWSRLISFAISITGFALLAAFNPLTETLLVFAIGLWVAGVGLFSKQTYARSASSDSIVQVG